MLLLFVIFLLPETARRKRCIEEVIITSPDNNQQEIVVVKKTEGSQTLKTLSTIFSPMIVMLGDPTVIIITIFNTVPFACLYFLVSGLFCHVFFKPNINPIVLFSLPQSPKYFKPSITITHGKLAYAISYSAQVLFVAVFSVVNTQI